MPTHEIKIVIADEHFLYLPLYFANDRKFFGELPKGYQVTIVTSKRKTDAAAFEMLMDEHMSENQGIDFAVCDPASALAPRGSNQHPVVLAGLLTNSAFWAVNHKANRVKFLEHLATFEKIIAFREGTTSFGIAKRIFPGADKANAIQKVDPHQELVALDSGGAQTIALSPDILAIHALLENQGHRFGIELALADTAEYRDMLVTAILTRRDVVREHPELVRGLLKAMQIALVKVRNRAPEVLTYAAERFSKSVEMVEKALAEAHRSEVYPANIRISLATWMKVAEIACYSRGSEFDSAARESALGEYRVLVEPNTKFAEDAVKELEHASVNGVIVSKDTMSVILESLPPVAAFLVLLGGYRWMTGMALTMIPTAVLAIATAVAIAVARWAGINTLSLSGLLYWLPVAGAAVCGMALAGVATATQLIQKYFSAPSDFELAPWSLWLAALGMLGAAMRHVHNERRRK